LIVPCSAESELALREAAQDKFVNYIPGDKDFEIIKEKENSLSEQQKKALKFIRKNVLEKYDNTGIQQCLDEAVFNFLKYIVVFPVENETHFSSKKGNILPDAYLLPEGSTPVNLAYAIHTDIGKNFQAAIDAKTKKRLAKDSKLKHLDIVKITAK